ncbi:methyltransferase domain-containing protein [Solirubrobacter sp. CPCC 204708]|uniref:Methyltransferase domain-containing protein n=1 Tax=Solirubrobacter deserti TaxID=2282478 RepID=A0ABT4RJ52_9ACTN|nr:methyltransferase domain-containing protein [Solirubrobacter deserti]MBE2320874.1 methyltransferase domain-containing protein [Solirubrobacter deserti]MDA0138508.1 methyltransferase domain-containing protein [Solirubrobacter deserti]
MDDDLVEEVVGVAGRDLAVLRPRDAEALLSEDDFAHDEFLPYWAELWPSATALARVIGARALRGRRTLELGCGLGLVGLAAAAAGARVTATDWAPDSIALLERNAARNGLTLEALCVDWASPGVLVERAPWELVLASDVLYEARNGVALAPLLPRLIDARGEIWLADPGRREAGPFLERIGEVFDIETRTAPEIPQGAIHRMRLRR